MRNEEKLALIADSNQIVYSINDDTKKTDMDKNSYFCTVNFKEMEFTVILEKMDNGQWFCQCEQVPEAVTQGATIEEAKENIRDAIEMVLAAKKELTRKQFTGRRILRRKIAVL
ncbi:MAG: type II toxin-antitoxin system HicB family antitoxin [Bacteroidales bacterium]|nr:type II toxin-antitoxin system HicB family antitoxin [Bacteroidales bacterium]MCR4873995.1 type II toxin-antitoxin system HicB family antitoxin [Bacteroidales bacterium]